VRDFLNNGKSLLFRKQTNILSAAFVIMAIYGLSHLVGLVKTRLLIGHFFGSAANQLDVYYAAFVLPDTLFQLLVVGALSAAFIPTFTKYLARDEKDAWYMATSSMNIVVLALSAIASVIFIFAKPISQLVAPGFSDPQILTMTSLMRIMLVAQIFFSISGFFTGMIQTHHRFLVPALAPVGYNLGIIIGIIFLSPQFGIAGPAIGVVIGAILHMLIQFPLAFILGFRFKPKLDINHPGVKEVATLMPPRAMAMGLDQVEQFVAVTLASLLTAGSLSIFNAARTLYTIPASLFGATIGQAAFPSLSKVSTIANLEEFRKILADSLLQILFISLPVSTLFIVLRIPIVRIIFGSSTFPWAATLLTGKTLAILAISASFYAVMQLVVRGFYALHDTATPLKIGAAAALFDVVFSVMAVYVFQWSVLGIAIGVSATAIVETVCLTAILYHRLGGITEVAKMGKSVAKMILISLSTGVGLWLPMRLLDKFVFDTTRTLPLLGLTAVTSIIGMGIYLGLSVIFKVEELNSFLVLFRRLGQWRKLLAGPDPVLVASEQN
jgi:putative peptidoglycan lipid II flippase